MLKKKTCVSSTAAASAANPFQPSGLNHIPDRERKFSSGERRRIMAELLEEYAFGIPLETCCDKHDIALSRLQRWRNKYKTFDQAVTDASSRHCDAVASMIFSLACSLSEDRPDRIAHIISAGKIYLHRHDPVGRRRRRELALRVEEAKLGRLESDAFRNSVEINDPGCRLTPNQRAALSELAHRPTAEERRKIPTELKDADQELIKDIIACYERILYGEPRI